MKWERAKVSALKVQSGFRACGVWRRSGSELWALSLSE